MDSLITKKIEQIFEQAAAIPVGERTSYLDRACHDNPYIRQEVESLLHYTHVDENSLDELIQHAAVSSAFEVEERMLGRHVGVYRLIERIGTGGMGSVYLAERDDAQFQQRVAIKLLHQGFHGPDQKAKFRKERQFLANLNHPNIAKLLDGGEAADGQPYLIMEYVDGLPIDEFCDSNHLDIDQRLDLFKTACSAVAFAHRNLVVHQDIKPSNILVNKQGIPKLLDFGIAKPLRESESGLISDPTCSSTRSMTPAYASPEQIKGNMVNTSSDIYSLGMVFYQLLCGVRPFDLGKLNFLDTVKTICETAPEKPSVKLGRLLSSSEKNNRLPNQAKIDGIVNSRCSSPRKLQKCIAGDLDAIAMKALRKEAEQRYETVQQFIRDIHSHQKMRPIQARKGAIGYYLTRYMRRNFVALSVSVLAMIIGLGIVLVYTQKLQQQRNNALVQSATVAQFFSNMFLISDPVAVRRKEQVIDEMLEKGLSRVYENQYPDNELKAYLLLTIGNIYQDYGELEKSEKLLGESENIQEQLLPESAFDLTNTYMSLGTLEESRGNYALAEKNYQRAESLIEEHLEKNSKLYLMLLNSISILYRNQDQLEKSFEYFTKLANLSHRILKNDVRNLVVIDTNLAAITAELGNLDKAEALLTIQAGIIKKQFGQNHRKLSTILHNQALVSMFGFELEKARKLINRVLEIYLINNESESGNVANTYTDFGRIEMYLGNFDTALRYLTKSLEIKQRLLGENHSSMADSLENIAELKMEGGEFDYAENLLLKIAEIRQSDQNLRPFDGTRLHLLQARMYAIRNDLPKAVALAEQALSDRGNMRFLHAFNLIVSLDRLIVELERLSADQADRFRSIANELRARYWPVI